MARCPAGPHRLTLTDNLRCQRCGEDLRLYIAAIDLPVALYNRARQLWDLGDLDQCAAWLEVALHLRTDLAEAHWLLGVVAARRGNREQARARLLRASELGAPLDPALLTEPAPEPLPLECLPQATEDAPASATEAAAPPVAEGDTRSHVESPPGESETGSPAASGPQDATSAVAPASPPQSRIPRSLTRWWRRIRKAS